jgi:hypothetical protein
MTTSKTVARDAQRNRRRELEEGAMASGAKSEPCCSLQLRKGGLRWARASGASGPQIQ